MRKKFICKIVIDIMMTVVLLFLMARQITGDAAHEWLGWFMFILWVAHHILNLSWYKHLFKGKYTPRRILQTVTNFAILLSMIGLMMSGIILARWRIAFLPITGGIAFARMLHMLSSFWGFVLMSLHLGLHWNMILNMLRKAVKPIRVIQNANALRIGAALIAIYGLYAFIKNDFMSYMFLRTHFVFFDFEKPALLFFAEYIAIMGLFIFLAHYTAKWVAFFFLLSLLLSGCGTQGQIMADADKSHTVSVFAMGTYMTLTAYGETAETALKLSEEKIKKLEGMWSVTDKGSDIYKANHSVGAATEISGETAEILKFSLDMAKKTKGALEPTIFPVIAAWGFASHEYKIPTKEELNDLLKHVDYKKVILNENIITLPAGMQLDLGAVGKGYTGDMISELLKEQGVTSALLNIGGNIQMIGRKPDGSRWRVGIQNPFGEGSLGVLEGGDGAVVTSGNYERYFIGDDGKRYGHIIDPSTGYPAENGLASVSVIAKEGKLCDALSTAVYVMGLEKAIKYWRENGGFEMLLVTDENEIYLTKGIENDFTLDENCSHMEAYVLSR